MPIFMKIEGVEGSVIESRDTNDLLIWNNGDGSDFATSDTLDFKTDGEPEPEAAVCHGVTVLAWARVDGVSPDGGLEPLEAAEDFSEPAMDDDASAIVFVGGWGSSMYQYG